MKTIIHFKIMLLCEVCFLTSHVVSQNDTLWTRIYDSGFWDEARAVVTDPDGNVYVTGSTYEWQINQDIITIKYDASGNLKWVRTLNSGSSYDNANLILYAPSGHIYVGGYTYGSSHGGVSTIIKYSTNGDSIWTFYNWDTSDAQFSAMILDSAENIIASGWDGWNGGKALTLKVDSTGKILWYNTFDNQGPNSSNKLYDLCTDAKNNVYVTGLCDDSVSFYLDALTIKYSANGDTLWTRRYEGNLEYTDIGSVVRTDNQGNVYAGGRKNTNKPAGSDYLLLKYDPEGKLLWEKTYSRISQAPNTFDYIIGMEINRQGNIIVAGETSLSNAQALVDLTLIKYNSDGDTIWTSTWGTPEYDHPLVMKTDSQENIYVSGYYIGYPYPNYNGFLTKFNSIGKLQWVVYYDKSAGGEDEFYNMTIDEPNIYVVGRQKGEYYFDMMTVKYGTASTGFEPTNANEKYIKISLYPNPSSKKVDISYYVPTSDKVSVKLFDISGKEIALIKSAYHPAGNHIFQYDVSGLNSGIYFCIITSGNKQTNTKLIIE